MRRLTMKEWCLISSGLALVIKEYRKMVKKQKNPAYKEGYISDIKKAESLLEYVNNGWLAMQEEGDNI